MRRVTDAARCLPHLTLLGTRNLQSETLLSCREAYTDAAAFMFHLENVSDPLEALTELAELIEVNVFTTADDYATLLEAGVMDAFADTKKVFIQGEHVVQ